MARIMDFILYAKGTIWKVFEQGKDLIWIILKKIAFWLLQGGWITVGQRQRSRDNIGWCYNKQKQQGDFRVEI